MEARGHQGKPSTAPSPVEADHERRAWRRLQDALDEVHLAAKALGLDVKQRGELYASLSLRADAWLWRSSQLLDCPRRQRRAA